MIPAGVDVFLARQPIDLRWGFDRLASLVTGHLGRDARRA
jgi:transposase